MEGEWGKRGANGANGGQMEGEWRVNGANGGQMGEMEVEWGKRGLAITGHPAAFEAKRSFHQGIYSFS